MRVLLDTHAFLWWLSDDRKLSTAARDAIRDPRAIVHVSAASIWEIAIKAKLGRLGVRQRRPGGRDRGEVGLPVGDHRASCRQSAGALPRHHDDPFDRMLIAQAQMEDLVVVTHDRRFRRYGVQLLAT